MKLNGRKELHSGIEGRIPADRHVETYSYVGRAIWWMLVHSSQYNQLA